jgi:hypothetical protein
VESPPRSEGRTLTAVLMPKQKSVPRTESRDSAGPPVAKAVSSATRAEAGSKE